MYQHLEETSFAVATADRPASYESTSTRIPAWPAIQALGRNGIGDRTTYSAPDDRAESFGAQPDAATVQATVDRWKNSQTNTTAA